MTNQYIILNTLATKTGGTARRYNAKTYTSYEEARQHIRRTKGRASLSSLNLTIKKKETN